MKKNDLTTELKIKEAAKKLFLLKGYASARTRDIATEAGINLALLNYYFRSKEKLFEIIMLENVQSFIKQIKILLDEDISMDEKIQRFANNYIDLFTEQPELPLFVLSELRTHPNAFIKKLGVNNMIKEVKFFREINNAKKKAKVKFNPMHLLINLVSVTIFPFAAKPMLQSVAGIGNNEFKQLMQERKKLIPIWFKQMLLTI